jgi:hypothetical protein
MKKETKGRKARERSKGATGINKHGKKRREGKIKVLK